MAPAAEGVAPHNRSGTWRPVFGAGQWTCSSATLLGMV
jgi:hypothetical protein